LSQTQPPEMPEISDLIVSFDPNTLRRQAVSKMEVRDQFLRLGNHFAAKIVADLPDQNGILDSESVDRLLIRVHGELQRMSEEFQHGRRVAESLRPILETLRQGNFPKPLRIVDIGCGTGFVIRWLAAKGQCGDDTELIGVDYNSALVQEATRLASEEKLNCRFLTVNAFQLKDPAILLISTGVIHHFRGDDLVQFFRQHDQSSTLGFIHFDFQPSPLALPGAWLFHAVRMRLAISKHDGVLSALRAHSRETLVEAARRGAPGFAIGVYGSRLGKLPIPRVFHSIFGIRPELRESLMHSLGKRKGRLEWFS